MNSKEPQLFHRTTDWFGLGGTLKPFSPNPLPGAEMLLPRAMLPPLLAYHCLLGFNPDKLPDFLKTESYSNETALFSPLSKRK